MSYPSVYSSFNRPNPTDRLNSPSHSALHNTVSSAVGQIEAVIGTNTGVVASAVGTLMYDVRSPDSNGGGHVQTANKGGTGQTTYTKGDLLVATSTSVLTKMAVGSVNGYALVVDQSSPTGLSYSPTVSNKIKASVTTAFLANSSALTVLFSASILGSTLGTNNAIKWTGEISKFTSDGNNNIEFTVLYGNNSVVTCGGFPYRSGTLSNIQTGTLSGIIVGAGATNTQRGIMEFRTSYNQGATAAATSLLSYSYSGQSSVESSAPQDLVIYTKSNFNGSGAFSVAGGLFVVEKIA